ncbi:MAG: FAD:protein FMN transferase, partial [Planctomycetota bacterium]|nr:FAD:protein FMN transferase [Planctomycetota bacterium]
LELAREIARAEYWGQVTGGAFSPLAEPLVLAWDLRGKGRVPSDSAIEAALLVTQPHRLRWRNGQPLRSAGAQIASGGFGKGASMDYALACLPEETALTLNLGGQVLVQGQTQSIDIAHPAHRLISIATWELSFGSLATSGNSERGITVDGKRFSHILDARTGQPAADFGSVTVWCENALDADCLSTALFALGPDEGLRLAASLPNVRALFVELHEGQPRLRATRNCQDNLSSHQTILWLPESQANNPTPNRTGKADQ